MSDNYHDQIAEYRQQRHQREQAEQLDFVRREYAQNVKSRDEAAASGDTDSFEFFDKQCEELEQSYAQLQPPQAPQIPPAAQAFLEQYSDFFQRNGQKAYQVAAIAHEYVTKPRDATSTQNRSAGMGISPDSPEYIDAMKNLMSMYSKDYGVSFDPDATLPTPNEIPASGKFDLSNKEYNRAVKKMVDSGHHSDALYGAQFKRSVG